ncbi:hypothetical protein [Pseudomonas sp. 7-41]|uniref:hypothetical protein n=1 Tax=Pseudomonas sp. 7-41 TaxID=2898483 RepID=UPI001E616AF7|nr:hypothetical protein [Pseudomonas sp. 7-41]UHG95286.1 hypothetical protein LQ249_16380 [Pseudomonas sp. 7-41]
MAKEQYKNTCMFCRHKNPSKEHMFPQWLRSHITEKSHNKSFSRTLTIRKEEAHISTQSFPRSSKNPILSLQTKKVCITCNNGWMSEIENKIIPIYEKLKQQDPITISKEETHTLSLWATMLAMKWDILESNTSGYTESDTNYLYAYKSPPPNVRVWLGHCAQSGVVAWHRTYLHLTRYIAEQIKPNIRSTTFMIGHITIHILSHEDSSINRITKSNSKNSRVIKIWPSETAVVFNKQKIELSTEETTKSMTIFCGMQHDSNYVYKLIPLLP